MRKSLLFLTLMAASSGVTLSAATLSPAEALQRALGNGPLQAASSSQSELVLCHTAVTPTTAQPAFYVFNRGDNDGFIIASADDCAMPLLGESESGSFNYQTLPDNLKWWLGEYERQIEWASTRSSALTGNINAGIVSLNSKSATEDDSRQVIGELLTTKWNQDEPYNLDCPEMSGGRAVTGCVATAMAQVMKYHEWPQGPGEGSNSYTYRGQTLEYDFSANTFDWANMLDTYNSSATQTQKDAVANLMYACGVSMDMQYSSEVSGAYSHLITYALITFFGYDSAASYLVRDNYAADYWSDIVYNEIASGRPVLYGGAGEGGGHQFVCDGYAGDDFFHINWGWGGYCDGVYLLSALDPSDVGIGGGTGGFNYNQSIIAGVGRPGEVDNFTPVLPLAASGAFECESYSKGSDTIYRCNFSIKDGAILNWSGFELVGTLGVCVETPSGDLIWAKGPEVNFQEGNRSNGLVYGFVKYGSYTASFSSPGTYHIYPAFQKENGEWGRIPVIATGAQCVDVTVDENGDVEFSQGSSIVMPTLKINDMYTESGYIERNDVTTFFAEVENGDAAYNGSISMLVSPADSEDIAYICRINLGLSPYDAGTLSFQDVIDLEPGIYDFYFEDFNDTPISEKFQLEVRETILATSITLDRTVVEAIEGDEFTLVATVLPENATNKTVDWRSTDTSVATVNNNGHVKILKIGQAKIIASTTDGSDLEAECSISSVTGIEMIEASDLLWDVITPSGVQIKSNVSKSEISSLAPGVYMLRNGERVIKIII